jgi:hypothetical protein
LTTVKPNTNGQRIVRMNTKQPSEPDLREHQRLISRALVQGTVRCVERMSGHIDRMAIHLDRVDAQLDRIEARMLSIDHAMTKCADALRAYKRRVLARADEIIE